MSIQVRRAVVLDAPAIANVNVASWRTACAHLLSPLFLERLSEDDLAANYRRALDNGRDVWVAEDADHLVGFARATKPREQNPPRDLELSMLYLLPEYFGSGTAGQLLDAAVGGTSCMLWVASDNPRAQAFYRRNRFQLDGETKIEEAWENMAASRMIR